MKRTLTLLATCILLVGCRTESDQVVFTLQANRFATSEWSAPVNLGPVVNSNFLDANAFLSADQHAMYFVSNRPGGLGVLQDIWMSRRACLACPWEAPVNLGAPINSDSADASPALSEDGRLLFFFSTRPGGFGGADLYVSHRVSTGAADVWGDPVNLGPGVNTAAAENGAYYVRVSGEGNASVFFNRPGPIGNTDIYRVYVSNDGVPLGPAVLVPELTDPNGADQKVAVRTDGLELFLAAIRSGGFGNFDIYRYTRQSANESWSAPVHLDPPINTAGLDGQPSLSHDGRTLIFASVRTGGLGQQDLWMSTRAPSGN